MPFPPLLKARLQHGETLVRAILLRFIADRCLIGASALSYTSIVSLVPLTAIVLVVFSGFSQFGGARDRLLQLVIADFAPDMGKDANVWFASVASHAAQTTAIGVIALVVTAILLLATVEEHLHFIFRVTTPRTWGQRVLAYWTVLTLGPILLGVGLSVTGSIDAAVQALGLLPANAGRVGHVAALAGHFASPALTLVALTLLYRLIPNRVVAWRACVVGGGVASVLLEVLKFGFAVYVAQMSSYSAVYGALAGIPIALLWMYIFWAVVLLGAETAAWLIEPDVGLS